MYFAWQAQYKRHVHEKLGGQGADLLREVAVWSIRSSGPQYTLDFRHMDWKNCKTYRDEAVNSALKFPLLKEVSQNCFVFDFLKFEN